MVSEQDLSHNKRMEAKMDRVEARMKEINANLEELRHLATEIQRDVEILTERWNHNWKLTEPSIVRVVSGQSTELLEPPDFDGTGVEIWISGMESFFSINHFTDLDKVAVARVCFDGDAQGWLRTAETDEYYFPSWEEMKMKVRERFVWLPEEGFHHRSLIINQQRTTAEYKDRNEQLVVSPMKIDETTLAAASVKCLDEKWRGELRKLNLIRPKETVDWTSQIEAKNRFLFTALHTQIQNDFSPIHSKIEAKVFYWTPKPNPKTIQDYNTYIFYPNKITRIHRPPNYTLNNKTPNENFNLSLINLNKKYQTHIRQRSTAVTDKEKSRGGKGDNQLESNSSLIDGSNNKELQQKDSKLGFVAKSIDSKGVFAWWSQNDKGRKEEGRTSKLLLTARLGGKKRLQVGYFGFDPGKGTTWNSQSLSKNRGSRSHSRLRKEGLTCNFLRLFQEYEGLGSSISRIQTAVFSHLIFIHGFGKYDTQKRTPPYEGYYLVLIFLAAKFVKVIMVHRISFNFQKLCMLNQSMIFTDLFKKRLRFYCLVSSVHVVGKNVCYVILVARQLYDNWLMLLRAGKCVIVVFEIDIHEFMDNMVESGMILGNMRMKFDKKLFRGVVLWITMFAENSTSEKSHIVILTCSEIISARGFKDGVELYWILIQRFLYLVFDPGGLQEVRMENQSRHLSNPRILVDSRRAPTVGHRGSSEEIMKKNLRELAAELKTRERDVQLRNPMTEEHGSQLLDGQKESNELQPLPPSFSTEIERQIKPEATLKVRQMLQGVVVQEKGKDLLGFELPESRPEQFPFCHLEDKVDVKGEGIDRFRNIKSKPSQDEATILR